MRTIRVKFLSIVYLTIFVTSGLCNVLGSRDDSSSQGLYNSSDHVIVLNTTTFKSTVHQSNSAWLVEFYNSWCGFCHRYAPLWKKFAEDVLGWQRVVKVAAIDCADDSNTQLCRDYEIMHYPLLRYFSPNEQLTSCGKEVEKGRDVESARKNLVDKLIKEQQEGRGLSWPNLTPVRNTEIENVWKGEPDNVKYYFVIFVEVKSNLGAEVILDLNHLTDIRIRRVNSDNNALCVMNGVTKFPSLIVVTRDGSKEFIKINSGTREDVREAIKNFLKSKGLIAEPELARETNFIVKTIIADKNKEPARETQVDDALYQADLDNTLRYSLNNEIPLQPLISDEKMTALKNYIHALAIYYPIKSGAVPFLGKVYVKLMEMEEISGENFKRLVRSTADEIAPGYFRKHEWKGCRGSEDSYRGYPCGLWSMFHTLSVNHALQHDKRGSQSASPKDILVAMHGYVEHFFGCADCSQHFVQMSANRGLHDVKGYEENVLWLWKAHNEVNARLAGDDTEDPAFPKIQYPSADDCPNCRFSNESWNEAEVLMYLKTKYNYAAIVPYSEVQAKVDGNGTRKEQLMSNQTNNANLRKNGWDFTIFDISICVVLYVVSAAILILVCIKFAVKKNYKKKSYIHSILGRV